jgi:hypothetical protein
VYYAFVKIHRLTVQRGTLMYTGVHFVMDCQYWSSVVACMLHSTDVKIGQPPVFQGRKPWEREEGHGTLLSARFYINLRP